MNSSIILLCILLCILFLCFSYKNKNAYAENLYIGSWTHSLFRGSYRGSYVRFLCEVLIGVLMWGSYRGSYVRFLSGFLCEVLMWGSYRGILCEVLIGGSYVRFLCEILIGVLMWDSYRGSYVRFLCEVLIGGSYVRFLSGDLMWGSYREVLTILPYITRYNIFSIPSHPNPNLAP